MLNLFLVRSVRMLLLDDYGLCGRPNTGLIWKAHALLRNTPGAGFFALSWYPASEREVDPSPRIARLGRCPILLQAAIWRRDFFLMLADAVHPRCSPRGFEAAATQVVKRLPRRVLFAADIEPRDARGSGRLINGLDKANWPLPYHNLMNNGRWECAHRPFLDAHGFFHEAEHCEELTDMSADISPELGPALWRELHQRPTRANLSRNAGIVAEQRWIEEFSQRLPCGECRQHWQQWTAAHPVDLSSPKRYFEWTYAAHQHVNARLGKPGLTFTEAQQLHMDKPIGRLC